MITYNLCFEKENKSLQFAAKELVYYISLLHLGVRFCKNKIESKQKIANIELCVKSNLRRNYKQVDNSKMSDIFSYNISESGGFFYGSNERSVILAIYDFFRKLGFVFLKPGKQNVYVPNISSVESLFLQKTYSLPFLFRGVCIEGANTIENVIDFCDWLLKNGFNSFFVQFQKSNIFFERYYNHIYNETMSKESISQKQLNIFDRRISKELRLRNILEHRVGHGWTSLVLGFSNTGWHVESKNISAKVKKRIALINGKRELWHGVSANTNLCYANKEARKKLIDEIVLYAKKHTSVSFVHVWLADEYNNTCECELCAKTTLSDQYVDILNELDIELTKNKLKTKIVFLLYQELLYPPLEKRIKNKDRFILMFAPISRTFEHSYPKKISTTKIAPYEKNKMKMPTTVQENIAFYYHWRNIFSGNAFVYDYPLGRAHYGDFGYMKIAKTIYEDIHSLNDLQFAGYMSCQELRAFCPTSFPNFVMAQSLYDLTISYKSLKEIYFTASFGKQAIKVIRYLETLSKLSDTDYCNAKGSRIQPNKKNQFLQIILEIDNFLPTIKKEAKTSSKCQKINWDILLFHATYSKHLAKALFYLCCGENKSAKMHYKKFCAFIQKNEILFQQYLDVYRITEVTRNYTGFKKLFEK